MHRSDLPIASEHGPKVGLGVWISLLTLLLDVYAANFGSPPLCIGGRLVQPAWLARRRMGLLGGLPP